MRRRSDTLAATGPAMLVLGLCFASACILGGCGQRQEGALATGTVLPAAQLPVVQRPGDYRGDTHYAVVRSAALPELHAAFADVLAKQGLVKWDARFDCNRFAGLWIGVAQARYAVAAWHSSTPAKALALAEVWYRHPGGGGHAIVQAITERGPVYLEPQTGAEITLTPAQEAAVFLRQW